jgi:hypothetical protein
VRAQVALAAHVQLVLAEAFHNLDLVQVADIVVIPVEDFPLAVVLTADLIHVADQAAGDRHTAAEASVAHLKATILMKIVLSTVPLTTLKK